MKIKRNDQFGVVILAPQGALQLDSFLLAIEAAVSEGHSRIAIDLSWVQRMTISQAGALSEECAWAAASGCRITLIGVSPAAYWALQMIGQPHSRRAQAIAS